jgi:predicted kinase
MSTPMLFLMFGYPGAGKTTVANMVAKITGAVHLSSDLIRLELFPQPTYSQAEHDAVYTELNKRAQDLLQAGKSVIYDANLNRYSHRAEKYDMCERTSARPIVLWVQTSRELARNRAVMRGHHHLVPKDETFETMFDRVSSVIEEPRAEEPVRIVDGTHVDESSVATLLEGL